MRFTVSSSALSSKLNMLAKVIGSKNSLPILDCFLFQVANGEMSITASDSDNVIKSTLALTDHDGEGEFCVPNRVILDALKELPEPVTGNPKYEMCGLRPSFYKLSPALYQKAGKCQELNYWDMNTQFCGVCGAPMKMATDISKKCTECGKQVWPSLATAIIVLIKKDNQVLLVHARNFKGNFDSLVAGFVETGENLEEAVHREVIEETGLTIKNLKYFGSQPWPYPSGLMIGFSAEYVDGEIHLQKEELSRGKWFTKENLPILPEKLSIARKLIDAWLEDKL